MTRPLILVLFALWAVFAGPELAAAASVYPTGLRVGLEPPGDLKPSGQFPGFTDDARKVSIGILELPGRAYEEIERSIFNSNQAGIKDVKRESFPFDGGIGFLLSGVASENGVAVRRWFLLAPDMPENLIALINVGVPETAQSAYPEAVIRKALASVSFRPTPIDEQLGLMPFKLNELAGFRVSRVLREGVVLLTDGQSDNLDTQPSMIISIGQGSPTDPADRGLFARDLLTRSPMRDLSMQSSESLRLGGLPGNEIRAQARALDGGPLSVVQWVRFGGSGFMRIVAFTRSNTWDAQYPRFRAVRDGIAMK